MPVAVQITLTVAVLKVSRVVVPRATPSVLAIIGVAPTATIYVTVTRVAVTASQTAPRGTPSRQRRDTVRTVPSVTNSRW